MSIETRIEIKKELKQTAKDLRAMAKELEELSKDMDNITNVEFQKRDTYIQYEYMEKGIKLF